MSEILKRENFLHGGNIYEEKSPRGTWIDFSANINPLGLSRLVRDSILDSVDDIVHYPDPKGRELKLAISDYYGVSNENILLGNGAVEIFYMFFHALTPHRVLLPVPSFSEYERAALAGKGEISYHFLKMKDDFRFDFLALEKKIQDFDVIILGNPNNPTGELFDRDRLIALLEKGKALSTCVLIDESFMDFLDTSEYTIRKMVNRFKNLIVIQSMTKFYALPGLRLGFAILPTTIKEKLERAKDPWNVNLLAQKAGVVALKDSKYQAEARKLICEEKNFLVSELKKFKSLFVYPASVNFLLLRILKKGMTSTILHDYLKTRGILIRDCSNYHGIEGEHIRIAVRTHAENEILISEMRKFLEVN